MDDRSANLVARWRGGDERAAAELFDRYTEQLLALARTRLSPKLAPRLDPEDVVQSAYRSFFVRAQKGAEEGGYVLQRRGDLWRLLAAITLHKLQGQVERHTAGKRSIRREAYSRDQEILLGLEAEVMAREPTPAEAATVVDELEGVLRDLRPQHRRMVEMLLQGCPVEEIARETERSERMVRLVAERFRDQLVRRWGGYLP